jgi:hypothetical protein
VKRFVLPVVVILSASSTAAADGVFFELGAPRTSFDGDLPRHIRTDQSLPFDGGHFGLGLRSGNWSVEATAFGSDVLTVDGGHEAHVLGLGGNLRRFVPLTRRVELFARAGVDHAILTGPAATPLMDYRGVGVHAGAGGSIAFFIDDARLALTFELFRHQMWLEGAGKDIDGGATACVLGLELAMR